jgi:hypothetical protein
MGEPTTEGRVPARLLWPALAVAVGWVVVVLPAVYAPRVLVGAVAVIAGLVLLAGGPLPSRVRPVFQAWLVANVVALAVPVIGYFADWPNATLLLGGFLVVLATLHLGPVAGERLSSAAGDDDLTVAWRNTVRLVLAGDAAMAATGLAWLANSTIGDVGSVVLAGLAVAAQSAAALVYTWAALQQGVVATQTPLGTEEEVAP